MNIYGANAALLLDLGYSWQVGCGLFIVGRVPGLLAHIQEEKTQEQPFRKLHEIDEIARGNNTVNSF
jgi:citrate synthase